MNTLSRVDLLLSKVFGPLGGSRSSSTPSTPACEPSVGTGSSSLHPRLSNLPPTPRKRLGRRPTTYPSSYSYTSNSLVHPTISSIQLPPPSTPFILRIALALWAILLAFWRSLVGETRAERKRRTRRGGRGRVRDRDGKLVGTDAKVSVEAQESESETEKIKVQERDGEGDGGLGGGAVSVIEEEEEEDERQREERRNVGAFTFRLRSASREKLDQPEESNATTGEAGGGGGGGGGSGSKAIATGFSRQPKPPSILSNPLSSSDSTSSSLRTTPTPITTTFDSSDMSNTSDSSDVDKPDLHQRRQPRLLPNPMSTSLLDPSLPAHSPAFRTSSPSLLRRTPAPTPFHLQKTLILDLDETLIHSTSRPLSYAASAGGGLLGLSFGGLLGGKGRRREGHTVEVVLGGRSTTYHVYKRPYVDHFLKKVASWYTLVIYTASMPEYADPVIDWLDGGRGLFAKKLYRESCHLHTNGSYIKDLALVEADLSRVCFMDNSPVSYSWNKANALPIEGWTSDPNDEALLHSIPVLDSLRFVNDVRRVLGIRGFS